MPIGPDDVLWNVFSEIPVTVIVPARSSKSTLKLSSAPVGLLTFHDNSALPSSQYSDCDWPHPPTGGGGPSVCAAALYARTRNAASELDVRTMDLQRFPETLRRASQNASRRAFSKAEAWSQNCRAKRPSWR